MGGEQNAEWYDERCRKTANLRSEPPWCSPWFPIWEKVVAQVVAMKPTAIIELGCGAGTMAEMLHEKLPKMRYLGSDFSVVNIQIAQRRELPRNYHFSVRDLIAEPVTVNDVAGTVMVSVEFLEHVRDDLKVLLRLPLGTRVVFTLPDHDAAGHVRFFRTVAAVRARYERVFHESLKVEEINVGSKVYFLGIGTRSDPPKEGPKEKPKEETEGGQ